MHNQIAQDLARNAEVFKSLFTGLSVEEYTWKPEENKWCLLEIICHLYDEEREDFRARAKHTLETPDDQMPSIDPEGWVKSRAYIDKDFNDILERFLAERETSIAWLKGLENPNWENTYQHEKFGALSAKMFVTNWVAHDYLHIRQILKLKYGYLKETTGEKLLYAGPWDK